MVAGMGKEEITEWDDERDERGREKKDGSIFDLDLLREMYERAVV